jgi:hypothetical protein
MVLCAPSSLDARRLPASGPSPLPPDRSREKLEFWHSHLGDDPRFAKPDWSDQNWQAVRVPHNWDDYHGYHAVSHGNLHGCAWYRTWFDWSPALPDERLYAFFEGVGSYAEIYINGHFAGEHAGGRTTFTVDLSEHARPGKNLLAVRAHHPEGIADLPFACGGCWGAPKSEGSQPFGIFRPAWIERTGPVRIDPFGIHVVTTEISSLSACLEIRATLSNPGDALRKGLLIHRVTGPDGKLVVEGKIEFSIRDNTELRWSAPPLHSPHLWSPEDPALHQVDTLVVVENEISHRVQTSFGLRWVEWPEILAPDANHNVVCADRRGTLVHSGETPLTRENNGLTEILFRDPAASARLAPMGARILQAATPSPSSVVLETELEFEASGTAEIFCEIQNAGGTVFLHQHRAEIGPGNRLTWRLPELSHPHRWSRQDPYLHRLIVEIRSRDGTLWERSQTLFGIRAPGWDPVRPLNLARPEFIPAEKPETFDLPDHRRVLKLNGRPLFLNGTCEYETLLGGDHAFTDEEIAASTAMIRAAGFNAFRDAHHPHNLRYYDHWDRAGIICWTQMGSNIWFDTPEFRANFRRLTTEWVKERRNHPCVLLWGLENESALPEDFAREIRDLIRELDPSSPTWRLTTTCNGGKGSDWNVPQEWSGTYGGNCHDYDLRSLQLVGEYGAWRAFGVHTEVAYAGNENDRSESWACHAMETKIRLGETARHAAVGHFHWVFNSFPNPGRTAENFEGPGNAAIGSINNKGLVTAWRQPTDLYYLYRSNYTGPDADPMVYLVSHTWPDRWRQPGPKSVSVFSNCEEVELFNGVGRRSLGTRRNPGRGHHFKWENVRLETNLLHAVGRCGGRAVAEDLIRVNHLPEDPSLRAWLGQPVEPMTNSGTALFRVNCGADADFLDPRGRLWEADRPWTLGAPWGWESWGGNYANVPDDLASRGFTTTPVRGSDAPELHREYRYGRQYLKYHFRTGPGKFRLNCHFAEPWFGVGGAADCHGWRKFDVAVNGRVVDRNLDIWTAAAGDHRLLVRAYEVETTSEILTLHFPFVAVGQAVIFAVECLRV